MFTNVANESDLYLYGQDILARKKISTIYNI